MRRRAKVRRAAVRDVAGHGEGGVVGRGALSTTRQVLEKRGVAGKDDDGSPLDK